MLIESVKKTLSALPPFKKVVVAVSGGPDSVALAWILRKLGYSIVIAHVNHGLRGVESDTDEALVKKLAKIWKVPFEALTITKARSGRGNLEDSLRKRRYAFLEKMRRKHKAEMIAVAHHKDDQLETVLMHLMRGAGVRGAAGMPMLKGHILRPLIGLRKKDLISLLRREGIPFRTDLSNFDLSLKRNLVRHSILPALKQEWKSAEKDLSELSAFAQLTIHEQEGQAKAWMERHVHHHHFSRKEFLALPSPLQIEILLRLAGHGDIYRKSLETTLSFLRDGATGKRRKIGKIWLKIQYDQVTISPFLHALPPNCAPQLIEGKMKWGEWMIENRNTKGLYVRCWKPGDRFSPSGMQGSKKLQDLFTDLKVPKEERHRLPIIVDREGRILGVANLRVARNAGYLKKCLSITKIQ